MPACYIPTRLLQCFGRKQPDPLPVTQLLTHHTVQSTIACRCGNKHQSTTPVHFNFPCTRITSAAPCPPIDTVSRHILMLTRVLLAQLDHPPDPTPCLNHTPSQFTFPQLPICNIIPPTKVCHDMPTTHANTFSAHQIIPPLLIPVTSSNSTDCHDGTHNLRPPWLPIDRVIPTQLD